MIIKPETRLSKNFKFSEFVDASNHSEIDTIDSEPLLLYLIPWLQKIRNHGKRMMLITSFLRDKEHNDLIGGVPNSAHLHGYAVDFTIPGLRVSDLEVRNKLFECIKKLHPDIRFKIYPYNEVTGDKWFCHIDCGRIYKPLEYFEWQDSGL